MQPKEFFLSLNKNGIPDEAWNYLQSEIIPDAQLEELTEGNVYFRETAKALNTFYPDSLSESIKLNLKSILEVAEPKPEREPEPDPEPIEDVTLPEPTAEPAKPQTSKKEVKAAVRALTTALRYAKDKKKFDSIKKAIKALTLQAKYMKMEKGGGVMAKRGVIALKREWTQNLQSAFDSAQDTHNLWNVELDRRDDNNVKLVGDKNQIESMKESLFNARVLSSGGSMEKGGELWYKYDFTTKEEFFDYIDESQVNGQFSQVRELWEEMPSSKMRQEFMKYARQQGFDKTIQYINENVLAKGGRIENNKKK